MTRNNDLSSLVVPVINLNGNTANDLLDKLRVVLSKTVDLQAAMIGASDVVHGRNFQTVESPEFARLEAVRAWRQRFEMLDAFLTEMREFAIAIDEQNRK